VSVPTAFLHPFAQPARSDYLTIVRGEGAHVFDDHGRRYIDGLASLWYCQIGHGRADMADAIATQVRTLENYHCFDRFTNEPAEALASEIAGLTSIPEARVFFTSSGSEAVDSALKLVRLTMTLRGEPDRHLVITRRHAYHGVTYGGMSAQGLDPNKVGFGPLLPGLVQVDHEDLSEVEALFAERGDEVAAVMTEPIMGAGGVRPPPPGYLAALRDLCDRHGALLVFDEVICAFGRLGRWWGGDHFGVVPDLATFAKGCTSGYLPLGGVVVGRPTLDVLEKDDEFLLRHGHTYSGHPTCCVAGTTNIEILRDEGLLDRAGHIGEQLGGSLHALRDDGLVAEVRGTEGIWAVEMNEGVSATVVRDAMLERGVIARPLGDTTLAFCPPLVISDADLEQCATVLGEALRS
jgi:adenosylmethionine-8-amino-7-oxononanoate aminotransferase